MTDENDSDFKSGFESGKDFKKKSLKAAGYAAGAAYSVAPLKKTLKKAILIIVALAVLAVVGIVGLEAKDAYDRGARQFESALETQNLCRSNTPDFLRLAGKSFSQLTNVNDKLIKEKCWTVSRVQFSGPKFWDAISSPHRMSRYFAAAKAEAYRNQKIDERLAADPPYTSEKFKKAWDAE
ncbi:MAG: hypothetical protein AAFX93_19375 [Verrucomicrobiota bacterium]